MAISDAARAACTERADRVMLQSALGGIPASILLVTILGASVPFGRRVLLVALVSGADIVSLAVTGFQIRQRRRGLRLPPPWAVPLTVALISAAWGSLAFTGLPDASHAQLRAIYLLFVCGVSATYVVGAAARRTYYYASQLPVLSMTMIGFLATDEHFTHMLAYAIPIYFAVMTMAHHEVHSVVVSEIQLRERNDKANAELRVANSELGRRASTDTLTELANRSAFTEHLQQAIAAHAAEPGSVAVLYFDLDRFKVVNDSLGHAAGDELLVKVAARVRNRMRDRDVLARFGGDEFTVLVDDVRTPSDAMEVAERIAAALAEPYGIGGRTVHVSASIGIAVSLDATDDAEALISRADAAQYRAKEAGRNRIEMFDAQLRDSLMRRLDDEQQLREALTGGAIVAWYQPIVDLQTGHIVGAEALARWQHPARGVLDAFHFVPLAEETGLVLALDDQVVMHAVAGRAALAADGLAPDTFRTWMNVSTTQFTRSNPTEQLAALLRETGCAPTFVGVEITETAVLENLDVAAAQIDAARTLGVKVALDDFGVGHSSLTLLRSLPIDSVKIDRSFVRDITHVHRDAAIVESVVQLATKLGVEAVAEGVETPEQARLLRELGCRYAQGWLWAKALPATALAERLRAERNTPALADS